MKHLTRTLALSGVMAALGTGVFAQDADPATMTCADFAALTADEQTAAIASVRAADTAADATTTTDAAGTDAAAGDAAATTATDTADSAAATESEASATDAAAADPEVAALLKACEGSDDALISDRLTAS